MSETVVGRYTIVKLLGRGGGGEVYEARAAGGNHVALKLLRRDDVARHPELATAFRREFCRLEQLRHPRIIEVYERGGDPAGLYYTMELLTGSDLRALAPLPYRRACELLRDVALSLAIMHSRRLVHRDVSPSNVRCTEDGRAKLLDFGATVTAGLVSYAIGTPHGMPPEALRREPIDARTDIYGLGALAYWLLAGRHAYSARTFAQLELAWRALPQPPSAFAPDVPEALDRLVMSMLSLDANARPGSAMEVINRLEAIADLAALEPAEAARASFVSPTLVGRAAEVEWIGERLRATLQGRGGSIIIEGESGMGRSRLLGHLVLEAASSELVVLHASALDSAARPYGVLRALSEELLRAAPDLAADAPPEELWRAGDHAKQRAFHEWLLRVSARQSLVLLVDDFHACDEPSAAVLAGLADAAENLLIVATRESGARVRAPHPVQSLSRAATRIRLHPLDREDTEGLIRSVLGSVPRLKLVADWVYEVGRGNPAQVVELIQCLVDRSIIRYVDGAWTLPATLDGADLPGDIAQALEQRLEQLSPAAAQLIQAMAVYARPMQIDDVVLLAAPGLAAHERESQSFNALDELIAAHVLNLEGETYRFRHRLLAEAVARAVTPEQRQRLHQHFGDTLLERFGGYALDAGDITKVYKTMLGAYHLKLAGDDCRGLEVSLPLYTYAERVGHVPIWEGNEWYVDAGLRGLEIAERHGRPPSVKVRIWTALVTCGIHVDHRLIRHAEPALEQLAKDTGLARLEEFRDEPDPARRIRKAIGAAARAYEATPEAVRGLEPIPAIGQLVRCAVAAAAICSHTHDVARMTELRALLAPLADLSAPLGVWLDYISAMIERCRGRLDREPELRARVLEWLERKELQTTDEIRLHMGGFTLYALGQLEAFQNPEQGLSRARELAENAPFMRYEVSQLELLAHIAAGNQREAQACCECMEISALQGGAAKYQVQYSGLPFLVEAYAMAGDLMGTKHMLEKLQPIAEDAEAWVPFLDSARAQYHRLRGRLDEALKLSESARRSVRAGEHRGWLFASVTLIETLLDGGQALRGRELAEESLKLARQAELGTVAEMRLLGLLARCESELLELDAGKKHIDAALTLADRAGVAGILRGALHEVAALLALRAGDEAGFERHASSMERHCCAHGNPTLLERYQRLLDRAERKGFARSERTSVPRSGAARRNLSKEVLLELGPGATPATILSMLLRKMGATSGFLFAMGQDGRLSLVAPRDVDAPRGLREALAASTRMETACTHSAVFDSQTATLTTVWRAPGGQLYQTTALSMLSDGELRTAGALAIAIGDEPVAIPRLDYLLAVGELLFCASRASHPPLTKADALSV
jgi:tRNA A-37 threonylcarbamoyl transferase component Bud32